MIHKLLSLFFLFFIGWIFPPVFAPAGLSVMGVLIAQGAPSWLLTSIIACATISSYVFIWSLIRKILPKNNRKNEEQTREPKTFLGKLRQYLLDIVQAAIDSRSYQKLTDYLNNSKFRWIVYFVMIFIVCTPLVSNVVAVLLSKSLKKLLLFASIGETIGAIVIVYGWEKIQNWVIQLFGKKRLIYRIRFFFYEKTSLTY